MEFSTIRVSKTALTAFNERKNDGQSADDPLREMLGVDSDKTNRGAGANGE